jgi:ABC-type bacteriocin/lantibiotic exporter with double-glycine peptidase domain
MIKETLAFLLENSCSESSTLVLETLNLQSSWIALLLTSDKHRAQAYKQASKQTRMTKNRYTKKNENLKRAYKRIGLVATVTRAQETRLTELRLKRNSYRKVKGSMDQEGG